MRWEQLKDFSQTCGWVLVKAFVSSCLISASVMNLVRIVKVMNVPCYLACIFIENCIWAIYLPYRVTLLCIYNQFCSCFYTYVSHSRLLSVCRSSNRGSSSSFGLLLSIYHQMALVGWAQNCTYTSLIQPTVSHHRRPASTVSASLRMHPLDWWKPSCRRSRKIMWAAALVHCSFALVESESVYFVHIVVRDILLSHWISY